MNNSYYSNQINTIVSEVKKAVIGSSFLFYTKFFHNHVCFANSYKSLLSYYNFNRSFLIVMISFGIGGYCILLKP